MSKQQYLLLLDEVADCVIRTAIKRCIHRLPKHPDQRPLSLRPPKLFLTKSAILYLPWKSEDPEAADTILTLTLFPSKLIGLLEQLPLGIVVIYNTVIFSWGRLYMTYTLSMVQKKIIYRLIRPKLSNVVISKQAWDTTWWIPSFWQYLALRTSRVFSIFRGVWPKGPTPVRERVKGTVPWDFQL